MSTFTIDLTGEMEDRINEVARVNKIDQKELIRRMFELLSMVSEQKKESISLGFVKENENHTLEAIGKVVGI